MRTAFDLFCSAAAGWTLGLSWAGVHTVGACEVDPARAAAYARRWGVQPHPDVRAMTGFDLPENLWLLCGSPPCQDTSEINHRGQGVEGDDTGLFFEVIRILGGAPPERRPAWVTLENVSGLRTGGVDRVLDGLAEVGYAPRPLVVGAGNAGADHRRERVWIVASDAARREGRPAGQPRAAPGLPPAGWDDHRLAESGIPRLEHLGAAALGRHLRSYDGVSSRVAEFARKSYGDAVTPIIPFHIARALIAWELDLWSAAA